MSEVIVNLFQIPFRDFEVYGTAATGDVGGGIGGVAGEIAKFGERIVFQMFAHGISQSLLAGVQGGDMLQSFVSGALSSIVSSAWAGGEKVGEWKGVGGNFAGSDIGTLVFGTAAGAGGAALTKGNIWQGAAIGLVVSGLNHLAHQEDPPTKQRTQESDKTEGWTNSQFRDLYEFNEFALDAYGFVRGAAELSTLKWGGFTTGLKGLFSSASGYKTVVQFGKGTNQVSHTFRHVEEMGLNANTVKSAILKNIPGISKNVTYGGKTIYTQIKVGGQDIIYSAHRLQNGTINVGRITGLTK